MILMLCPVLLTGCKENEANTYPETGTVAPAPTEDNKLMDYNIKEFTYTKYEPRIPGVAGIGYEENVKNAILRVINDLEANKLPFQSEIWPNQVILAMPGEGYLIHNNRSDNTTHMNVLRKKDISFKEKNENGKETHIYYNGSPANPFTTVNTIIKEKKFNNKPVDIKCTIVGDDHKLTISEESNVIFTMSLYETRFFTTISFADKYIELNGFFDIELERVNGFINEFNSAKGFTLVDEKF